MPAPKTSSLAAVVVTVPLVAAVPVPEAEAPTSNGLTGCQPAVLQGADVDVGGGGVEGGGDGVGAGGGGLDVGGVVDRLADPAAARGGHRQLIGVARRIGHRGDGRGRVVPADRHDIGVARRLRPGVGDRHRGLTGLRRGRPHLHKSRRGYHDSVSHTDRHRRRQLRCCRRRRVASGSQRMRAIGRRRGIPGHAVGRGGVLGAQCSVIQQELHPGHTHIVASTWQ